MSKRKKFIAGGCSFTFGHELSDDDNGRTPSKKTWAYGLYKASKANKFVSSAYPGTGNSGIARRLFNAVTSTTDHIVGVVVMWSFNSRYDWAMPRHKKLEDTRWTTISPWDTVMSADQRHDNLKGSEVQMEQWKRREEIMRETGVGPFADSIYRHAANEYHETYLSWKSIIWLQNILQKKKIPYLFTLADNSLFYRDLDQHKKQDSLMTALHDEIDFGNWFTFGERMMGFNQWATLNDYEYATTHPLDQAHRDAVKLMLPTFKKLIGGS
jgi:hypothetical protein